MCMDNCIKRYENKIVLVTGASRGIGAAIAARFAKEGAVVIVNYSGNDEAADRTVENILAANGKAEKYKCQVDSYEETEKMIPTRSVTIKVAENNLEAPSLSRFPSIIPAAIEPPIPRQ